MFIFFAPALIVRLNVVEIWGDRSRGSSGSRSKSRSRGRSGSRRVSAVQVSHALNASDFPNDATSIAVVKMKGLIFDDVGEQVQYLVDGRVRGVLIKRLQQSEMHALQLQDDVGAIERVGIVSGCSRGEQVAGVGLRTRASDGTNENANILQLRR